MLSNNLTLEEEDAVQAELRQLQAVSLTHVSKGPNLSLTLRSKHRSQNSQGHFRRCPRLSPCLYRMVRRSFVQVPDASSSLL
jgi:hypothetical protein